MAIRDVIDGNIVPNNNSNYITGARLNTTLKAMCSDYEGKDTTEQTARENADTALANSVTAEATARTNADTVLGGRIDAEVLARQGADTTLQGNITAEVTARQGADTTLQGNITAEATAREAADTALGARIDNIGTMGRFLSVWDCSTGLAQTNPTTSPYTYITGDWFVVGKTGTTNYKPSGATYTIGVASTAVESGEVKVNDIYKYDGTSWSHLTIEAVATAWGAIGGNLANQTDLATALASKYVKPSGGIPSADMATGVQTSLELADSAYQKPSSGIPSTDLASRVQTSLGKADSAYQKPSSGIPATDMASGVVASLRLADSAYQKPNTGIPSSDMTSAVQTSLSKADSAYQKPANGIPSTDLASGVQTSLGKADTALQSVPNTYRTASAQDVIDAGKQNVISDLDTIRSGAALGATALQSVPNTYRTSAEQDTIDNGKQATLVSGTNIKTINNQSILGAGNIEIQGSTDIIYGYMHNSVFYLTKTGSTYSDAVTPVQNMQYTDKEGDVPYIWDGTQYKAIGGGGSAPTQEVITFDITSSDGQATLEGLQLTITIDGQATPEIVTLNASGQGTITIPVGSLYSVAYPIVQNYARPVQTQYAATSASRTISKTYTRLTGFRSIVIEESSSPIWTLGGQSDVIDNILAQFGTYVIDEANHKFAKLSAANHANFDDGTPWAATYGNAFRRFPRVYYKITTNIGGKRVLNISNLPFEDETKFWEETWIGSFKGSVVSGILYSRPGMTSTQSMTMTAFWNAAQALSRNYGLVNYFDFCELNALHLCKFGTANSQTTMGPGLQDAGQSYYTHSTGATLALGDGTGQAVYSGSLMMNKLFGIEDLAGSTWEFRPNIRFGGTSAYVYTGNKVDNGGDYIRTFVRNANLNGEYTTEMSIGSDFDLIPTLGGGSSSTYWCDGGWSASAGQLLVVGGSSSLGSISGLSAASSSYAFSASAASVGARLAFRGDISEYELVTGAEMAALH